MSLQAQKQDRAELILGEVTAAGGSGDVIIDSSESLQLSANQGKLDKHQVSSTQVYGVRVIKDGKVGIAYSEADDSDSLRSMVAQALTNAEYAGEEQHETIMTDSEHSNVQLHSDDALLCPADDVGIDAKIELVLQLERELTAKTEIKSVPYNGLQSGSHGRSIYSTAGLSAHSQQRQVALYAYGLAEAGEKNAMEGSGQVYRQTSELHPDAIISTVYENCLSMLEGKPVASGRYDVIFDNETLPQLIHAFEMVFSGKSAKDGKNPWRDKLGQIVADERLVLADDPTLIAGMEYSLFDAEGSKARKTNIIQGGKLETLLHNSVTANHFGLATTGNAQRSAKSSLGIAMHQLTIAAGNSSLSTLRAGKTIEITDLTGIHSGANAISGDFSFGASGYLCQDGQRQQAIRGITVAGNFYKMLNRIADIGDQQQWNWQKSSYLPLIRFADVAISGD